MKPDGIAAVPQKNSSLHVQYPSSNNDVLVNERRIFEVLQEFCGIVFYWCRHVFLTGDMVTPFYLVICQAKG